MKANSLLPLAGLACIFSQTRPVRRHAKAVAMEDTLDGYSLIFIH
jgi:hypothetical protein